MLSNNKYIRTNINKIIAIEVTPITHKYVQLAKLISDILFTFNNSNSINMYKPSNDNIMNMIILNIDMNIHSKILLLNLIIFYLLYLSISSLSNE